MVFALSTQRLEILQIVMMPEVRLDQLERMAMLLARAGFRARSQLRARDREQDKKINHLINLQISNEERFARNEERFAKLAESQTNTDRRLNSLIDIIREGRYGTSRPDNQP